MNVPKIRTDPRIRQNLNHLQNTFESATDTARAGCFAFTKTYLEPLYECLASCCTTCSSYIPDSDSHSHHHNQQRNNNSEFPFDFYNDDYWYDYDDGGRGPSGGFLAWGNDELDRLLAGSSSTGHRASPGMYYGSHSNTSHHHDIRSGALGLIGGRRNRHIGGSGSNLQHADGRGASDPTVIPSTSVFGFLGRFPWWGRVERRYRPSAADLQEHPSMPRDFPHHSDQGHHNEESQGLLPAGPSNYNNNNTQHQSSTSPNNRGRKRSQTSSSGTSGESFRSRGDLFPSDAEDDAVPLGDEFSIVLRSSGGSATSDVDGEMSTRGFRRGSVLSGMSPAPPASRRISMMGDVGYQGDASAGEEDDDDGQRTPRGRRGRGMPTELDEEALKTQEAALAEAEEREIERKRAQAKRLALERGLTQEGGVNSPPKFPPPQPRSCSSPPRAPHAQFQSNPHPQYVTYTPTTPNGMLSPMSLPANSPRVQMSPIPPHAISPRMYPSGHPRSPNMRSPVLASPSNFHQANLPSAAAAAALKRPMSPISPLGGSPRTHSPMWRANVNGSENVSGEEMEGGEVEIVMSPEEISRSGSGSGYRSEEGGLGLGLEMGTRRALEIVDPHTELSPVPSVERASGERMDYGGESRVVEGGGGQVDGAAYERRRQEMVRKQREEEKEGEVSGILPHLRPSA